MIRDPDKPAIKGSNQCKYNCNRLGVPRYYTICMFTVNHTWVSDHMIDSDEVFTPRIVQRILESEFYQVESVEEYYTGWAVALRSYSPDKEERKAMLSKVTNA